MPKDINQSTCNVSSDTLGSDFQGCGAVYAPIRYQHLHENLIAGIGTAELQDLDCVQLIGHCSLDWALPPRQLWMKSTLSRGGVAQRLAQIRRCPHEELGFCRITNVKNFQARGNISGGQIRV